MKAEMTRLRDGAAWKPTALLRGEQICTASRLPLSDSTSVTSTLVHSRALQSDPRAAGRFTLHPTRAGIPAHPWVFSSSHPFLLCRRQGISLSMAQLSTSSLVLSFFLILFLFHSQGGWR